MLNRATMRQQTPSSDTTKNPPDEMRAYFQSHYAQMNDEELMALRLRPDLVALAYEVLDQILAARQLDAGALKNFKEEEAQRTFATNIIAMQLIERTWRQLYTSGFAILATVATTYFTLTDDDRRHSMVDILEIASTSPPGISSIVSAICFYYFLGKLASDLQKNPVKWILLSILVPFGVGQLIALICMWGYVRKARDSAPKAESQIRNR